MKLQTIDGEPLSTEEFKMYMLAVLKTASTNKDFNNPQFLYDLRLKCDMTFDELLSFVHEMQVERLEKNGLDTQ